MSKQDDYMDEAARTFDLATRTSSSTDKFRLLNLAELWLDLADRRQYRTQLSARQVKDHPLVEQVFRGLKPEPE